MGPGCGEPEAARRRPGLCFINLPSDVGEVNMDQTGILSEATANIGRANHQSRHLLLCVKNYVTQYHIYYLI